MSEQNEQVRLTVEAIANKQFRRAAYGYEQREVDDFLDEVCDEIDALHEQIDELTGKLNLANAETRMAEAAGGVVSAPVSAPEASFREILEMAQRVKEQTIAEAQKKAEEIVANAQNEADAVLGGLELQRTKLQEAVNELRQKATGYRDAVKNLLAEHQAALELVDLDGDAEA